MRTYFPVKLQENIKNLYPELIEEYEIILCRNCRLYIEHVWFLNKFKCDRGLLPVTSNGGKCPYFSQISS